MSKRFFDFLFFMVSVLVGIFGGGAVMMSAVAVGSYGSDTDPNTNTGKALEGGVQTNPSDKGGIAQHGQGASASALDDAGMVDYGPIFQKVVEYHANKYPFYSDMMTRARQINVPGKKEATYPEMGEVQNYALTKSATTAGAVNTAIPLSLYKNDAAIFQPHTLIFVDGMGGYDDAGQLDGSRLVLYVESRNNNGMPVVSAINGPLAQGGTYVPAIADGTKLIAGAPALNEVEVEVAPDNIMPTLKSVYLQKKGYAIEMTDFFKSVDKEASFGEKDIKNFAHDNYKKKYTLTTFFSAPKKFYTNDSRGFRRLCYTQEGVIQQLRMAYQTGASLKYEDLIGISKMLFTKWTNASSITLYCEADFIEQLLNLDFGKKTPIVYAKDETLKCNVATFECTFGKLRFVYEQTLTELGLIGAAIALPVEDCIRVTREGGKTLHIDGKKGEGGRVEEVTASYFIQDDAVIAPTMCSMLIGPASVFSMGFAPIESKIESVATLPANPSSGDLIYLTVATSTLGVGAYKYDGTNWVKYTREVNT